MVIYYDFLITIICLFFADHNVETTNWKTFNDFKATYYHIFQNDRNRTVSTVLLSISEVHFYVAQKGEKKVQYNVNF